MLFGGSAAVIGGTTWEGEHAGDAPSRCGPAPDEASTKLNEWLKG
jgi:hypothetical protein